MIRELDRIVLTKDLPEEDLKAGDIGTVVHVYREGAAYEVKFLALSGETLAVITVPADTSRPVTGSDITHARSLKTRVAMATLEQKRLERLAKGAGKTRTSREVGYV